VDITDANPYDDDVDLSHIDDLESVNEAKVLTKDKATPPVEYITPIEVVE